MMKFENNTIGIKIIKKKKIHAAFRLFYLNLRLKCPAFSDEIYMLLQLCRLSRLN